MPTKPLFLTLSLLLSFNAFADNEVSDQYTGELTFTDNNNKQDILYLIYGHEFSHRVMNYKDGKLDGMSFYVDQGGNPVLFEWYEDGVLVEQMSGAHEAVDRGINYGPKCEPADDRVWRSCPKMGQE